MKRARVGGDRDLWGPELLEFQLSRGRVDELVAKQVTVTATHALRLVRRVPRQTPWHLQAYKHGAGARQWPPRRGRRT